jgi:hypothetical protein
LAQGEHAAALVFRAAPDRRPVLMVFDDCAVSRFGYPNDEALSGHPLYEQGLSNYSCFEVLDSSWRSRVQAQNLVAFPTSGSIFSSARHFAITFHDTTFECLADDLRWEWVEGSTESALRPYLSDPPIEYTPSRVTSSSRQRWIRRSRES